MISTSRISAAHALVAVLLFGCQAQSGVPHLRFRSSSVQQASSIFTTYCMPADIRAARDVARELEAQLPRLRLDLQYDYRYAVAVEIYPDQMTYDAHLMDPSVRGSPACSGRRTIQMVSPRSPIRIGGISYADRLGMAVHELAHLFLNEINGGLPLWLQEGVASFEGGAALYRDICKRPAVTRLLLKPPSLDALGSSQNQVAARDVFSFTFVDYVVTQHGIDALNRLIRNPAGIDAALGSSKPEVEARWHAFLKTGYAGAEESLP